ncbi:hypothetical protein COCNU_06G014470 [Cocos nucifera]|uniref:Uncharacterized protein n=1 Tax=Cocos nucifera TaxID=13894 RepID=A0A8K0N344_COCNU|nr:hypothetical protein COCNU_06G014470 [Cocos nucifera]
MPDCSIYIIGLHSPTLPGPKTQSKIIPSTAAQSMNLSFTTITKENQHQQEQQNHETTSTSLVQLVRPRGILGTDVKLLGSSFGLRLGCRYATSDSVPRHASGDFKKMGPRIFIFIIGGATRSELRAVHKLTSKLKREVILGSSSLDDPPQFITVSPRGICVYGSLLADEHDKVFRQLNFYKGSTSDVVSGFSSRHA